MDSSQILIRFPTHPLRAKSSIRFVESGDRLMMAVARLRINPTFCETDLEAQATSRERAPFKDNLTCVQNSYHKSGDVPTL
jgi:hypothetical protein